MVFLKVGKTTIWYDVESKSSAHAHSRFISEIFIPIFIQSVFIVQNYKIHCLNTRYCKRLLKKQSKMLKFITQTFILMGNPLQNKNKPHTTYTSMQMNKEDSADFHARRKHTKRRKIDVFIQNITLTFIYKHVFYV